jgi:hypothetical protein
MDANEIAGSLIGWALMLAAAFWYARRAKHPSRGTWNAFGIFVGVFGGIALTALLVLGGLWDRFMPEGTEVPWAVGGLIALAVIIPAWNLAVRLIKRPAKSSDQSGQDAA